MNNIIKTIIFTLVLAGLVYAQRDEDLGSRIRQFATRLNRLQTLAQRYDNTKAAELLNRAVYWFNQARESWDARRYREAKIQFDQSVNLYNQASRLLFYKPALNLKNTLDDIIHKAEISLQKNDSRDGRYLLNKARDFQLKANRQMNLSDYVKGQEYLRIAIHFAQKAIEVAERTGGNSTERYNYEEELKHIQELYRELQRTNSDNRDVNELLQKADAYINRSKNLNEESNERQAFHQLQIAEKLLFRAIDLAENDLDNKPERFENNLNSLRQYLYSIELNLTHSDDINAKKFYNKAITLMQESEKDYENGDLEKARTKLLLAQKFANRALRFSDLSEGQETNRIENRIEEISSIIQLQKQKIDGEDNRVLLNLHSEAEDLLQQAKRELEKHNQIRAFQLVQLSMRLINRIDFILQKDNPGSVSDSEIANNIKDLDNKLNRLFSNENIDDFTKTRIQLLMEMLSRARNHYDKNDLITASELIRIVQSQFNLILEQNRD